MATTKEAPKSLSDTMKFSTSWIKSLFGGEKKQRKNPAPATILVPFNERQIGMLLAEIEKRERALGKTGIWLVRYSPEAAESQLKALMHDFQKVQQWTKKKKNEFTKAMLVEESFWAKLGELIQESSARLQDAVIKGASDNDLKAMKKALDGQLEELIEDIQATLVTERQFLKRYAIDLKLPGARVA